jgi:malate dehydrogenase (oxaloacetate-decarboxylating)
LPFVADHNGGAADTDEQSRRSVWLHGHYRGKIQILPKCPIRRREDLAVWYTPGVAAACRAIQANPERVFDQTNKANSVAVVSDGTRVLGLGDIGPEAGLPVMEGKALLFKYLGGVDAFPVCLATRSPKELIRTVEVLTPSFGAINLEDIAQPQCFEILDTLRGRLEIPIWHDDQQGSATVLLAALGNALEIVGKSLGNVRIALVGTGAANVSTYRLLRARGIDAGSLIACDSRGTLHTGREDIERESERFRDKWRICQETNADRLKGGNAEALRGADVCVAFSTPGPNTIRPEWVRNMRSDAIVFACANPVPEIWPQVALEAGARIVGTGRSDFANQVNNALAFPGIFRGVLDVRAKSISDEMAIAAADALSSCARSKGLREDYIVPRMDELETAVAVAVATGIEARAQGLAKIEVEPEELRRAARATIERARAQMRSLDREGLIEPLE